MSALRWGEFTPVSARATGDDGWSGRISAKQFLANTSGDIAIVFGLMAAVTFMSIGAAVDFARFLSARDQTMAAIDAAILAGARSLQTDISDKYGAIALAKQYYEQAIKDRGPLLSDNVVFYVVDSGTAMVASGDAKIATPFMGLAGVPELPLLTWSAVAPPKAIIASGGNADANLEIAIMLDTSNTMANASGAGSSKIADMKAAASDLVNIVVWNDQSAFTSRVALVPFSGDVRIPAAWQTKVRDPAALATQKVTVNNARQTYLRTPCYGERMAPNSYTDAAPGAGNYVLSVYSVDGQCSEVPLEDEIVSLTSDKAQLLDKISKLALGAGSAGHVGAAWAYYMLSPNWSTVLPSASTPAAYGAQKTNKVAVLMTDGAFNFTHDSKGVATAATGGNANGLSSADQAIAVCRDMKRNGIQVYTVGINLNADETAINTLTACASDVSKFYDASGGSQLKAAFRDIALHVSALRLAS
jgi:von Willebrand factor type A domain